MRVYTVCHSEGAIWSGSPLFVIPFRIFAVLDDAQKM